MGGQAFQGKRGQHFYCDPHTVTIVGLDTDHKEGEHPLWDERIHLPIDEALVRNIGRYGNKDACKVRKVGKREDGTDIIEVIEGRQRTRHTRIAYDRAIEAGEQPPMLKIEFERVDEETAVGIMISLNEQRRNDGIMTKARKAVRVLQMGSSHQDVADMFGVTTGAVRHWEKGMELSKPIHKAIEKGQLTFSAAVKLHGLTPDEQVEKLKELTANGQKATVANAGRVAKGKQVRRKRLLPKPVLQKMETDEDFVAGLSPDARALVKVMLGDEEAVDEVPGLRAMLDAQ